jgi:xylulokinase
VPVAGGGGDQAAGAIGAGVIAPGQAFVSLGTSGVYFVADNQYRPNPDGGVHTFCHALPKTWHQMAVILSAASCVTWVTKLTGAKDEGALIAEVEEAERNGHDYRASPIFLPYLSGERTPHNDPLARGVFHGLCTTRSASTLPGPCSKASRSRSRTGSRRYSTRARASTKRPSLAAARAARSGARFSPRRSIALYRVAADVGPALGAARLARIAVTNEAPAAVCTEPPVQRRVEPKDSLREIVAQRYELYRALYRDLRESFVRFNESLTG